MEDLCRSWLLVLKVVELRLTCKLLLVPWIECVVYPGAVSLIYASISRKVVLNPPPMMIGTGKLPGTGISISVMEMSWSSLNHSSIGVNVDSWGRNQARTDSTDMLDIESFYRQGHSTPEAHRA